MHPIPATPSHLIGSPNAYHDILPYLQNLLPSAIQLKVTVDQATNTAAFEIENPQDLSEELYQVQKIFSRSITEKMTIPEDAGCGIIVRHRDTTLVEVGDKLYLRQTSRDKLKSFEIALGRLAETYYEVGLTTEKGQKELKKALNSYFESPKEHLNPTITKTVKTLFAFFIKEGIDLDAAEQFARRQSFSSILEMVQTEKALRREIQAGSQLPDTISEIVSRYLPQNPDFVKTEEGKSR